VWAESRPTHKCTTSHARMSQVKQIWGGYGQ